MAEGHVINIKLIVISSLYIIDFNVSFTPKNGNYWASSQVIRVM